MSPAALQEPCRLRRYKSHVACGATRAMSPAALQEPCRLRRYKSHVAPAALQEPCRLRRYKSRMSRLVALRLSEEPNTATVALKLPSRNTFDRNNSGSSNSRRIAGSRCSARHPKPLPQHQDRKSTRLNSSHSQISYAVFCLKKKKKKKI